MTRVVEVPPLSFATREARTADAERLAALAMQVWLHTYATNGVSSVIARFVFAEFTPARFEQLMASETITLLVAEAGEHLIGYASIDADAPCPVSDASVELATLYVSAHFAGLGVGSRLLADGRRVAAERTGDPALWAAVYSRNLPALAFYARQGFALLGHTSFELGGEHHDNQVLYRA